MLNASGYVTARRRATVSSKVTGKVLEVFVEEGKAVRKGQVLARLDDSQIAGRARGRRGAAGPRARGAAEDEARLREAELTLERREQLVKEGVIGRAELDAARGGGRVAQGADRARPAAGRGGREPGQRAARPTSTDMVVRAPFDGVAISKDAQPGEMISPVSAGGGFTRTGIGTIVDMSSLEIEVDVSESYINRVRPGQPVEAVLDAYPDWRIPGARHHDRPVGRPAEGDGAGAHRLRLRQLGLRRSADPAGHGREGVVPARAAAPARRPRRRARGCSCRRRRCARDGGRERRVRRAATTGSSAARSRSAPTDGDRSRSLSGLNAGERVVVDGPRHARRTAHKVKER